MPLATKAFCARRQKNRLLSQPVSRHHRDFQKHLRAKDLVHDILARGTSELEEPDSDDDDDDDDDDDVDVDDDHCHQHCDTWMPMLDIARTCLCQRSYRAVECNGQGLLRHHCLGTRKHEKHMKRIVLVCVGQFFNNHFWHVTSIWVLLVAELITWLQSLLKFYICLYDLVCTHLHTAFCSHLYCVVVFWRWKAGSPGFPPSPGFPEASPAKAKSLVASHLMMHVAFQCHATACQPYDDKWWRWFCWCGRRRCRRWRWRWR